MITTSEVPPDKTGGRTLIHNHASDTQSTRYMPIEFGTY